MSLTYTYNCTAMLGPKWFVYDPYSSHELNLISMITNLVFTIKTSLTMNLPTQKLHKWVKFMWENSLILYWKVILQENRSHKRILERLKSQSKVCLYFKLFWSTEMGFFYLIWRLHIYYFTFVYESSYELWYMKLFCLPLTSWLHISGFISLALSGVFTSPISFLWVLRFLHVLFVPFLNTGASLCALRYSGTRCF